MDFFFSELGRFVVLFIIFILLLLRELKKKPEAVDEEEMQESELAPPKEEVSLQTLANIEEERRESRLSELHSSLEGREVHSDIETRTLHGLLDESSQAKELPPSPQKRRRSGRQLMLSHEILSSPLSQRPPRI